MKNTLRSVIAYSLYPFLLAATLAVIVVTLRNHWDLQRSMSHYLPALLVVLMLAERAFPMSPRWGMTWRSF